MRILAIETSCDETAIAVVDADVQVNGSGSFTVLGNALQSQIDIHQEYGGVFPAIAKREHARNLVPVLAEAFRFYLDEDSDHNTSFTEVRHDVKETLHDILAREQGLADALIAFIARHGVAHPNIDAIAVTSGPGLEPALWVGVSFAKALAFVRNVPLVAVNHMEGHIVSGLAQGTQQVGGQLTVAEPSLPLIALLISGGHTELVAMHSWLSYELVGATRDDAVGEAFDKVARMLGLPYPGGPEVSKLAAEHRTSGAVDEIKLPRPMIHDPHCDFSFSGLKTAVLYRVKDRELEYVKKCAIARAFEDAVADVLWSKTARALESTNARTLVLGGGVSANSHIRDVFQKRIADLFPTVSLYIPHASLTGDNAVMIALAGGYRAAQEQFIEPDALTADGTWALRS